MAGDRTACAGALDQRPEYVHFRLQGDVYWIWIEEVDDMLHAILGHLRKELPHGGHRIDQDRAIGCRRIIACSAQDIGFGRGQDVPVQLAVDRQAAREARVATNRAMTCETCSIGASSTTFANAA